MEAVRIHGGEGVMGAVGVHTPDLPNSLAWLSPKEELTFGEVDHTIQLRWFILGESTDVRPYDGLLLPQLAMLCRHWE